MDRKKGMNELATVILRGYGDYYGHVIKAQVIDIRDDYVTVQIQGELLDFERDTGFEDGQRVLKTGYQMVPESLSVNSTGARATRLTTTLYNVVEKLGKINP